MSGVQQDINFGRHSAPKRLLCLATYHKGGTIWMKHVITALSKALDIPWVGIWGAPAVNTENTTETQSGSMSRQATTLSSAMSPECSAGTSLFTGGACLCPQ